MHTAFTLVVIVLTSVPLAGGLHASAMREAAPLLAPEMAEISTDHGYRDAPPALRDFTPSDSMNRTPVSADVAAHVLSPHRTSALVTDADDLPCALAHADVRAHGARAPPEPNSN